MAVPRRRETSNNRAIGSISTDYGTRLSTVSRREALAWITVFIQLFVIITFQRSPQQHNHKNDLSTEENGGSSYFRQAGTTINNNLKQVWHGGTPDSPHIRGTCWCSAQDDYCMCNPSLAIDVVLISSKSGDDNNSTDDLEFWLVQRKDTNQYAFMGGFVKVGESAEDAVVREMLEETGLTISKDLLKLIGFYSDPHRDKRRHTAGAVFVAEIPYNSIVKANDDVKEVKRFPYKEVLTFSHNLFADHQTILEDYLSLRNRQNTGTESHQRPVHLMKPIERSICASV